jgi:hypothetical protein
MGEIRKHPTENISIEKVGDHTFVVTDDAGLTVHLTREQIKWLRANTDNKATRHGLNSGLVKNLRLMARTIKELDRNDIHIYTEMEKVVGRANYSNLSNITNLRFHGLVAKVKDREKKTHIKGRWLITKRGWEFLRGDLLLPKYVLTRDNKVVGHDGADVNLATFNEQPIEYGHREDYPRVPSKDTL